MKIKEQIILGEIKKNNRKIIRISLQKYYNYELIDIRVMCMLDSNYVYTKRGISIQKNTFISLLNKLTAIKDNQALDIEKTSKK